MRIYRYLAGFDRLFKFRKLANITPQVKFLPHIHTYSWLMLGFILLFFGEMFKLIFEYLVHFAYHFAYHLEYSKSKEMLK